MVNRLAVDGLEVREEPVPREFGARMGEGVRAAGGGLGRVVDDAHHVGGERIEIIGRDELARGTRRIEIEHREESAATTREHGKSGRHRLEWDLRVGVVDGRNDESITGGEPVGEIVVSSPAREVDVTGTDLLRPTVGVLHERTPEHGSPTGVRSLGWNRSMSTPFGMLLTRSGSSPRVETAASRFCGETVMV